MSRYYDGDYGEDFNNQGEFWRANAQRAMKGKRGRKALADLREALLNLPEKRLIGRAMRTVGSDKLRAEVVAHDPHGWHAKDFDGLISEQGEGVCAVGAYAWWQKVKAGADPEQAFEELPLIADYAEDDPMWRTMVVGQNAGLTQYVAWELAYRNDEKYAGATPERRYELFMAWLDEELADV